MNRHHTTVARWPDMSAASAFVRNVCHGPPKQKQKQKQMQSVCVRGDASHSLVGNSEGVRYAYQGTRKNPTTTHTQRASKRRGTP